MWDCWVIDTDYNLSVQQHVYALFCTLAQITARDSLQNSSFCKIHFATTHYLGTRVKSIFQLFECLIITKT